MQTAHTLYGNGTDLDTDAIQELLDSGTGLAELPMPAVCYLIDRPLRIPSRTELRLPRYCTVRLKDGCNCHMLENADPQGGDTDIRISGGIWDMNNMGQLPNPFHFPHDGFPAYDGIGMYLKNVRHLTLCDMTFKDPTTFACTLDIVSYFTVEHIRFDFNRGNPRPMNMDGIHLDGNCHYGYLHDLKGTCYDDLAALNADEGSDGPISHIVIDGIYAEECHSAVRLLTVKNAVEDIHITNVFGSYYQYCIGVTKYYEGETDGYYDGLVFDNIHAEKSTRYGWLHISEQYALHGYVYPLIYIEGGTVIRSLHISDLYRTEKKVPCATVFAGEGSRIGSLTVRDCSCENRLGTPFPFFDLRGETGTESLENIRMSGGPMHGKF